MAQQETFSLTVAATIGKWLWAPRHGMQSVLHTSQLPRMSGLARMPPRGSSLVAIATSS